MYFAASPPLGERARREARDAPRAVADGHHQAVAVGVAHGPRLLVAPQQAQLDEELHVLAPLPRPAQQRVPAVGRKPHPAFRHVLLPPAPHGVVPRPRVALLPEQPGVERRHPLVDAVEGLAPQPLLPRFRLLRLLFHLDAVAAAQPAHRLRERHPLAPHQVANHVAALLAAAEAVPRLSGGRDVEARRLLRMERAAAHVAAPRPLQLLELADHLHDVRPVEYALDNILSNHTLIYIHVSDHPPPAKVRAPPSRRKYTPAVPETEAAYPRNGSSLFQNARRVK